MSRALIESLQNGELPTDFNWQLEKHALLSTAPQWLAEPTSQQAQKVQFVSEDLRDGLHGIKEYPSVEAMLEYIGALDRLGIKNVTIGIYPGKGTQIDISIRELLVQMRQEYPAITPIVLSLATQDSLNWLIECKELHPNLTAIVFMGTAPSRILVEEWSQDFILKQLAWAIDIAVEHNIDVIGATEHTTQTPPDFLKRIITTQVEHGAKFFCIADTIGIARPIGTYRIVQFVKQVLAEIGAPEVLVDWHGHDDQGNGVSNALAAISAGADRIHTVARGIGERAGNTMMEAVLLNLNAILKEHNMASPWDLRQLNQVLNLYDHITQLPTPDHGALGARSHVTSLGIHTSAMLKAQQLATEASALGYEELAAKLHLMSDQIYTAIPPELVGKSHTITVSPWSGMSTVLLAYKMRGGKPENLAIEVIQRILRSAKDLGRELTEIELNELF